MSTVERSEWNTDDRNLLLYICATYENQSWDRKLYIFNAVCGYTKRPLRTKGSLSSTFKRYRRDSVNPKWSYPDSWSNMVGNIVVLLNLDFSNEFVEKPGRYDFGCANFFVYYSSERTSESRRLYVIWESKSFDCAA